jgi:hypothetical protein
VGVLLEVRITILVAKYIWLGLVVCAPLASRSGVKNLGRNPLNSFESAGYGPRSTFGPLKFLILKNLTAKSWIDWA